MRAAVLLCGLGLVAGAAMAQDAPPAGPPPGAQGPPSGGPGGPRGMMNPERRAGMLQKRLSLSDDQTTQVKAIFEDGRTKMEALRSNTSLSQEDRRAQMMALHQTEDTKVEAVLTPDQKTKYEAMQAEMHQRMQDHQQGAPGAGAPPPPPPQN
jgi:periplasmic protein CpxP/Spy